MSGSKLRVLLDECLPHVLRHDLAMFDVQTADYAQLAGLKNGALLTAINGRFDVFVTVDANLQYQHDLASMTFGINVLRVPTNRLSDIRATVPRLQQAVSGVGIGQVQLVG
jgi:hypothetical protein